MLQYGVGWGTFIAREMRKAFVRFSYSLLNYEKREGKRRGLRVKCIISTCDFNIIAREFIWFCSALPCLALPCLARARLMGMHDVSELIDSDFFTELK